MSDSPIKYWFRDVGLHRDRKFHKLRRQYGYWSIAVYEILLDLIFEDKGYYIEYNDETKDGVIFDVLSDLQGKYCPNSDVVEKIISGLVDCKLFSASHFNLGYLTSCRIQKAFYRATVERKNVQIDLGIWMLSLEEMETISKRSSIHAFVCNSIGYEKNRPRNEKNRPRNEKNQPNFKQIRLDKINISSSLEQSKALKFYCENINPRPTAVAINDIAYWLDDVGVEDEMLVEVMEYALRTATNPTLSYIKAILEKKTKQGIKTAKAFRASEEEWKSKKAKPSNKRNSFSDYANQREFDPNDISERQQQLLEEILEESGGR